jgi:hypothetical protein
VEGCCAARDEQPLSAMQMATPKATPTRTSAGASCAPRIRIKPLSTQEFAKI